MHSGTGLPSRSVHAPRLEHINSGFASKSAASITPTSHWSFSHSLPAKPGLQMQYGRAPSRPSIHWPRPVQSSSPGQSSCSQNTPFRPGRQLHIIFAVEIPGGAGSACICESADTARTARESISTNVLDAGFSRRRRSPDVVVVAGAVVVTFASPVVVAASVVVSFVVPFVVVMVTVVVVIVEVPVTTHSGTSLPSGTLHSE